MTAKNTEERAEAAAQAFGILVRRHREERRLSQARLAEIVGVSRRTIMDLEGGKSAAYLGTALLIAQAVGVLGANLGATPVPAHPNRQSAATGADDDLPDLEDTDVGSPRVL